MKLTGLTPDVKKAVTEDTTLLKRFVQVAVDYFLRGRNDLVLNDDFFAFSDLLLLDGVGISIENLTIGVEMDASQKANDIPAYFNVPQINDGTDEVPVMRNAKWEDLTYYTRNDGLKIMFAIEGSFANFKQLKIDEPSVSRITLEETRAKLLDANPTTGYYTA